MVIKIHEPIELELRFQEKLRKRVLKEIELRSFDNEFLSKKLGLFPSGVQLLLEKQIWPIELGVRIAVALGLKVILDIE